MWTQHGIWHTGAKDVLENCHVVPELKDALVGVKYLVAQRTAAVMRVYQHPVTAREAAHTIASVSQDKPVALLFDAKTSGCPLIR